MYRCNVCRCECVCWVASGSECKAGHWGKVKCAQWELISVQLSLSSVGSDNASWSPVAVVQHRWQSVKMMCLLWLRRKVCFGRWIFPFFVLFFLGAVDLIHSFIHFTVVWKSTCRDFGLARVLGHSWQWTSCLHITERCVLMRIQIFSKLLWKLISTKNDWEWTAACTKLFRNVKHCSRSPAFMEEHYVL